MIIVLNAINCYQKVQIKGEWTWHRYLCDFIIFKANLLSAGRVSLPAREIEEKIVLSIHKGFLKQTGFFLYLLLGNSIQQLHTTTTSRVHTKNIITFFVIMTGCYYGGRLKCVALHKKYPTKSCSTQSNPEIPYATVLPSSTTQWLFYSLRWF